MIFIENFSDPDECCVTILFLFHFKNGKKFKMIISDFNLESETNTKTSSMKLRSRDTNVYSFLKDGGWINSRPTHYSQQQSLIKSYGY